MKQNERFLVYAVTGFLALILVVAVVFGREPGKEVLAGGKTGPQVQGLNDMLGQAGTKDATKATGVSSEAKAPVAGLPSPNQVAPNPGGANPGGQEQPLVAGSKLLLAADLVAQQLGGSRRDRTVRFVHAKSGDSLEMLVRRWCGAREPFLAEAKSLNEDLVVLRVGQEVAVPWVEDEALLAVLAAQKPKTLVPEAKGAIADAANASAPPAGDRPSFAEPGHPESGGRVNEGHASEIKGERTAVLSAGTSYTVKEGDSLWRIAERTYGRKNADRMVAEIKKVNPGLDDRLPVGQKLVLPKAPAGGA